MAASRIPIRVDRKEKTIHTMVPNSLVNDRKCTLERVLANKKQTEFQDAKRKLEHTQTKLMKKLESLRPVSVHKEACEAKLIAGMENHEWNLLVNEDYKKKMALVIPAKPINKIIDIVNKAVDGTVESLMDKVEFGHSSKDDPEHQRQLELIRRKIEEKKNEEMVDLPHFVSTLTEDHSEYVQMQKELEENKEALRKSEMELADLNNSHLKALELMEKELEENTTGMSDKRQNELTEVIRCLETLETQNQNLKTILQRKEEEKRHHDPKMAKLTAETKCAKEKAIALKKQLIEADNTLIRDLKYNRDLLAKLEVVKLNLDVTKKNLKGAEFKKVTYQSPSQQEKNLQRRVKKLRTYTEKIEAENRDIQSKIDTLQKEKSCAEENNRLLQARIELLEEENQLIKEHQGEVSKLKQSVMKQTFEMEKVTEALSEGNISISLLEHQVELAQKHLDLQELFGKDEENNISTIQETEKIQQLKDVEERNTILRKKREEKMKTLQQEIEDLKRKLVANES